MTYAGKLVQGYSGRLEIFDTGPRAMLPRKYSLILDRRLGKDQFQIYRENVEWSFDMHEPHYRHEALERLFKRLAKSLVYAPVCPRKLKKGFEL